MPWGLEPLHAMLALTRRPMRVLTAVIEIATLAVFDPGQHLALGRAVALELIGDDDPWHVLQPLEQLAEKLLRRLLVAPALHQDIQHVIVLVNSAPQVMALPVDGQKDFIQVPFVPGLRATATQAVGIILPKLPTPLTDSFMGHGDATLAQEFLHVAVAQGEAIVKPDAMTDNFTGKAVVLVSLGVGRRGHVWLPILGCNGSWRGHRRGQLCYGSGRMVNKLTKPRRQNQ